MKTIKKILAGIILLSILPTCMCILTFDSKNVFYEEAWLPIFAGEIGLILIFLSIKWAVKELDSPAKKHCG